MRRFMARKGAVVFKEMKTAGVAEGLYSDEIVVSTMVIGVVVGEVREMSYGIKLERNDSDGLTVSSVFVDFDEIGELAEALEFIARTAHEMMQLQRDYTEVTYSTKDSARFGFYQDQGQQKAFVALEAAQDSTFLQVGQLSDLRVVLLAAMKHLESRGAVLAARSGPRT
ncbi:MAG: hypothetical protein SF066_18115 [Thermoanaerobaculia bacterium]|nr:hypothetical protein [Thermoanaerobaculia bacterium]